MQSPSFLLPWQKQMTPVISNTVPAYHHDDRLCVVRALKFYLALTEARRGGTAPKTLLRSMVAPHNPASPQTISKWIVRLVKMAYELANKSLPGVLRAHSSRAMAPSWASLRWVSLRLILEAAD